MRETLLFLLAIVCSAASLIAQGITFNSSLEEAKKLAEKTQKPLAVLITINPPIPSPNFLNGLSDKAVIEKYNTSFVNYRVAKEDVDVSMPIIQQYSINTFPSLLFLDPKGGIIFKEVAYLARAEALLALADKAILASKEKSLSDYDSEYKAGNNSNEFLRAYISRRQKAGITNNSDLVEQYASTLTVRELDDYREVLFILKAGPLIDSNAYKLSHLNKRVLDSIYRTEPLAIRTALNNAMITNTMNRAIAEKNVSRATAAANFTRSTWAQNFVEGNKSYYNNMLHYFRTVKDTGRYLSMAVNFYDEYYMNISVDSMRKRDSLAYEKAKTQARMTAVTQDSSRRTFSFTYSKNDRYETELNNAAWSFYELAGRNDKLLLRAMLWSKRAIEFNPRASFYDTYAHLLYKMDLFSEAESMALKSIEMAKAQKADSRNYEDVYKKIKAKTL